MSDKNKAYVEFQSDIWKVIDMYKEAFNPAEMFFALGFTVRMLIEENCKDWDIAREQCREGFNKILDEVIK